MMLNVVSKMIAWVAVLFFLGTISGLSQTKSAKVLADSKLNAGNLKETSETGAPTVNAPGDFRIGVNDVIDISVWKVEGRRNMFSTFSRTITCALFLWLQQNPVVVGFRYSFESLALFR